MKHHILLIDDSESDIELTRRALTICRIDNPLTVVEDGVLAIEYFEKTLEHDYPIFVLLDLKLPRVSGLEVLRWMRSYSRTKMLPIVVFTSSAEESDVIASYNLGANSYMTKPVDFDKFVKSVEVLGLYWLILNKSPYYLYD